jgi:hypothetical protein
VCKSEPDCPPRFTRCHSVECPVQRLVRVQDAERLAAEILGAPGDPRATADALLKIVDTQEPPLRVLFGTAPLNIIDSIYKDRLKHWEEWQSIAVQAHG